jgi:Ni,Fe-hydrogenase III component G
MESLKKTENTNEKIEALKRALIGVNNKRMEALLLMNAISEEYLPDIVEYLWILNGLDKTDRIN